jgi:hypothetical protein
MEAALHKNQLTSFQAANHLLKEYFKLFGQEPPAENI